MTDARFDGREAVVTGAGGGPGKIYALELARRGAQEVVNDLGGAPGCSGRSSSLADATVKEILKLEAPDLEIVLDVHLKGAFSFSQPAFRALQEQSYVVSLEDVRDNLE